MLMCGVQQVNVHLLFASDNKLQYLLNGREIFVSLPISWPTINIRPHIMHFRRLVFSYTE